MPVVFHQVLLGDRNKINSVLVALYVEHAMTLNGLGWL